MEVRILPLLQSQLETEGGEVREHGTLCYPNYSYLIYTTE